MPTTPFSINKIITFVVFLSAALISSLFIYHMRAPHQPLIDADSGMLFPVARNIKPFKLVSAQNEIFDEKNFANHWTLLFFGFTHCASICPVTLDLLQKVYPDLHQQ